MGGLWGAATSRNLPRPASSSQMTTKITVHGSPWDAAARTLGEEYPRTISEQQVKRDYHIWWKNGILMTRNNYSAYPGMCATQQSTVSPKRSFFGRICAKSSRVMFLFWSTLRYGECARKVYTCASSSPNPTRTVGRQPYTRAGLYVSTSVEVSDTYLSEASRSIMSRFRYVMCKMLELFYLGTPLDLCVYPIEAQKVAENLIPISGKRKVIAENQTLTDQAVDHEMPSKCERKRV